MFGMNITEMAGAVLLEPSKTHNPFNFSADYGRNYSSTTTKGDGYQSEGRFNSMAPPMGKPRYGVLYSNCAFNGVKDIGADDLFMDLEYDDDEDDVYVLSPSQRRRMLAAAARQAKKAQKKAAAAEAKTTAGGDSIGKRLFGKLLKLISVKSECFGFD